MAAADRIKKLVGLGVNKHIARALTPGTTVSDPAAITSTAPPAGGTGATAGAYDTAQHRDDMIASVTAVRTDVASVRTQLVALMTELRDQGIIS